MLSWAITIHKCQSLSLEGIIVDLGESIFEDGMAYVALSRAKQLKNVILLDFVPSKIKCNKDVIQEYNRLRAKYAPDLGQIDKYNVIPFKYRQLKSNLITKNIHADIKYTKSTVTKITYDKPKRKKVEKEKKTKKSTKNATTKNPK